MPNSSRWEVADWLEARRDDPQWGEDLIVNYARKFSGTTPDDVIEHLVAMPRDESNRAAIVASFATPGEKDGELRLPHPPDSLKRLIDAAALSPDAHAEWIETVDGATWR